MQWKSDLRAALDNNDGIYLLNESASTPFIAQSELVLMGKNLNTTSLLPLVDLLTERYVTQAKLASLGEIEGVGFIRLSLNKNHVELNSYIKQFADEQACDFALVAKLPDFSQPGLVLMDMDSTTIQTIRGWRSSFCSDCCRYAWRARLQRKPTYTC